jgi:hypothetical protein
MSGNVPASGNDPGLEMAGADPGRGAAAHARSDSRRWIVLTDSEQRSWEQTEQNYAAQPATRSPGSEGLRALAIGAVGLAVIFAAIGAPLAGLVVLVVPALGWVLARHWRDIGNACATVMVPMDGRVADDPSSQTSSRSSTSAQWSDTTGSARISKVRTAPGSDTST